jgi:hypothetical protein
MTPRQEAMQIEAAMERVRSAEPPPRPPRGEPWVDTRGARRRKPREQQPVTLPRQGEPTEFAFTAPRGSTGTVAYASCLDCLEVWVMGSVPPKFVSQRLRDAGWFWDHQRGWICTGCAARPGTRDTRRPRR